MSGLRFEKYEGLGNDFVVVEAGAWGASGATARAICDRHFGVGADGVLVVGPGVTAGSAGSMVVLNADGSRPEMCGNGLRCVALYLAARRGAEGSLVIDTDSGPLGCEVAGGQVAIEMGKARLDGPVAVPWRGREVSLARVSMGNPHAVTFDDLPFDELAPGLSTHEAFPQGANVEFASEGEGRGLRVRVWERGAGPTLACGTGACAVVAAACASGLRAWGEEVAVGLPGGELRVTVRADLTVKMVGPARRVFAGEVGA